MRTNLDFSSWQAVLSTLLGLVLVSVVAIGIRLLLMHGVQLRRERQNRQINERLKTLIAAYRILGGSFTGELVVDPSHLRELRLTLPRQDAARVAGGPGGGDDDDGGDEGEAPPRRDPAAHDRPRRTRDAVEAALSDVILLGTEAQVRLAARAAQDMVAGRSIGTAELVTSLRDFIREVLDLEAIPVALAIPRQGPTRASSGGSGRGAKANEQSGTGGKAGGRSSSGTGGNGGTGAADAGVGDVLGAAATGAATATVGADGAGGGFVGGQADHPYPS